MENDLLIKKIRNIIKAFNTGVLGEIIMPEDTHPKFKNKEENISFFTLPMALNYQRNSYKLWEAATKTFDDPDTNSLFDLGKVVKLSDDDLRKALLKYKLALQPNNHIKIWKTISSTIHSEFGSFEKLLEKTESDFLNLKEIVQVKYKKGFPYLSGPKIFNYWSYILTMYADIPLKNRSYIEIAPDTHVIQASVKLGVISKEEVQKISRDMLSKKWREILRDTKIDPIDVHEPLWFWSHTDFKFNPQVNG